MAVQDDVVVGGGGLHGGGGAGGSGDPGNVVSGRGLRWETRRRVRYQGLWGSGYCCQWVVYRNELVRCTRPLWGQLCGTVQEERALAFWFWLGDRMKKKNNRITC